MRSSQFASYIYIVDTTETCSGGCDVAIILDEDAFSGGGVMGVDAQITISLTPGTYMIFANSNFPFLSFEIGDYSLETNFII